MKILKTACALAVLATSSISVMAESVDIKVTGTITPPSCTLSLGGDGSVDYGNISYNTLSNTRLTALDIKSLDLTIQCDAKTKVALMATNGRVGSAAGTTEGGGYGGKVPDGLSLQSLPESSVVGLGMVNNKKIGGYAITLGDVKGDGKNIEKLYSFSNGYDWDAYTLTKMPLYGLDPMKISWGEFHEHNQKFPDAFTNISGKLYVEAYINKTTELDISQPITLDGLTTLELHYL